MGVLILFFDRSSCLSSGQLSSNFTLPLIAIIISIISLVFSYLTIRHNWKTVEPYLIDTYYINYTDGSTPYQALHIKNCGFGPAIITTLYFEYNGKKFNDIMSLLKNSQRNIIFDSKMSHNSILKGYIISSNDEKPVFKIAFSSITLTSYLTFQKLLSETSFTVKYESIYKRKKILYSPQIIQLQL